ncbi:hypothetical protein BGZ70_007034 [Mortierella alpina]|uniref:Uncharacterized protein n=1 Tax=Mortierella alpina TaxID=64518 RepID=A0A9P6J719_MORAP|nr:hypothetical protein BGZ70_007034 [Mortierella alpina]
MDETPPHVHSQACEDSCPVQDIYTEAGYFHFSKGARTNLYGLAVLKELGTTASSLSTGSQPTAATVPSNIGSSIFSDTGELAYGHLPGRYVLVAAGSSIKCFLGLQYSFDIPLGLSSGFSDEAGNTTAETPVPGNDGSVATAPAPNQEIVSIDAFERKDERGCQLVVIVSIAKQAEDTSQFELRCYGANTFGSTIRELLLQLPDTTDIQTIPLSWAPTKITHAPVEEDPFDMAILVGGSDSCVHLFVQDRHSETSKGLIEERSIESYLPVLASFVYCEYCVLSLVIKDYSTYRIVAAGTQNGTLNVGIIPRDPKTFQLQRDRARSYTVVLFAPITTLTVYTSRVQTERSARKSKRPNPASGEDSAEHEGNDAPGDVDVDEKEEEDEEEGIHLLVTCAIEQAWVYSDINKHGLGRRSDLAECSYHDSILAAHVMDADWDGRNEIMTGTYGRQLMVFKEIPPGQDPFSLSSYAANNTPGDLMGGRGSRNYGHDPYPPTHPHQPYPHPNHPHHSHHPQHSQQQHPQHPRQRHEHIPVPGTNSATNHHNGRALQCSMTWNRRFASPIYGISSADLNDDGLEELVITTLNGVSFFLPDPIAAKQRLLRAVTRMQEIEEMKLTLEKLRQENEELKEARRVKEEKEKQLVKEKEARELEEKEKQARELEEKERKEQEDEAIEGEGPERKDQESRQREEHEVTETANSESALDRAEGLEKAQSKEDDDNDGVEERVVEPLKNEDEEQVEVENEDEQRSEKGDEKEEKEEEEERKEDGNEAEKQQSEENNKEAEKQPSEGENEKEAEKEELTQKDDEVKEILLKQEQEEEEDEEEEERPEEKRVVGEKQSDDGVDTGRE